jgi:tetratricopeptide (TPR) repeat protein
MTLKSVLLSCSTLLLLGGIAHAQTEAIPTPSPAPTPRVSDLLAKVLDHRRSDTITSREDKEKAYAKLLEGQRYIWNGDRLRSMAGRQNSVKLAKRAFQESVEFDPSLSEGYTALAELAINGQPQDADEAIKLALLAVKVNPNNFGAHRILARLYSFQSRISGGKYNPELGNKAIAEWNQVVHLDPRNAEAWALLSELYDRSGKAEASIDALKKWLASAAPIDSLFYQRLMGGASLSPETASMKLGSALLKAGRTREASETLSALIADDPGNTSALDLLREALENANPETGAIALESLKQAVFANPENLSLVELLAQLEAKSGRLDDAIQLLRAVS